MKEQINIRLSVMVKLVKEWNGSARCGMECIKPKRHPSNPYDPPQQIELFAGNDHQYLTILHSKHRTYGTQNAGNRIYNTILSSIESMHLRALWQIRPTQLRIRSFCTDLHQNHHV
eukprot:1097911_1